ncbi:MAG: hypothetical protein KatS3mg023_1123 [Armatimonadota bacterium]|nr:MAG: hypothetical protein KatS3mg023_1123 [Armatimonadota bacterium]
MNRAEDWLRQAERDLHQAQISLQNRCTSGHVSRHSRLRRKRSRRCTCSWDRMHGDILC